MTDEQSTQDESEEDGDTMAHRERPMTSTAEVVFIAVCLLCLVAVVVVVLLA